MRAACVVMGMIVGACAAPSDVQPDAWSADAGFHGCRWTAPPSFSICDHFGFDACARWALGLTAGSDLEAFAECSGGGGTATCSAADVYGSTAGPGTCGGAPACAGGYACARLVGEGGAPTCVRCEP